MAYRFLNPAPVFFALSGEENANGGTLTFYTIGTTTPKDTWSDPAMGGGNLNSNPVELDSAGRSNVSIWLDGEYSVVLKDAEGETVWTRDVTSGIAAGAAIPALVLGQYLTNDGTNLLWSDVASFLLPDPSGSADYILSTDGENFIWIPQPELPDVPTPDIAVTSTTTRAAEGDVSFYVQSGTGSADNVGGRTTSESVVYATPFVSLYGAPLITPTGSTYSSFGNQLSWTLSASSVSGFTVKFTMGELDDSQSGFDFNAAVPFGWVAFGTIASP